MAVRRCGTSEFKERPWSTSIPRLIPATSGASTRIHSMMRRWRTPFGTAMPRSSSWEIPGPASRAWGLVLSGREWTPTESTHGRHVWTFAAEEVSLPGGVREKREILLWDLAGQPGYRLVHQLHLGDVAVALVVFD